MASPLGEFLMASRERVSPGDVGLPDGPGRRVHGLRREEVAVLAGVSVDYYMRLEQGRENSPSSQVAARIGHALQLDEYGLAHLYRLAGLTPGRAATTPDRVEPDLQALINGWQLQPAIVLGHAFDVIAANPLGEALFLGFSQTRNLLESLFLDEAHRRLYVEWDTVVRSTVAGFRLLHAAQPDDDRIAEVLDRLSGSSVFLRLWSDHETQGRRQTSKHIQHPRVGLIELRIQTFDVRAVRGQELVVYRAEPGSVSEERLRRLSLDL